MIKRPLGIKAEFDTRDYFKIRTNTKTDNEHTKTKCLQKPRELEVLIR